MSKHSQKEAATMSKLLQELTLKAKLKQIKLVASEHDLQISSPSAFGCLFANATPMLSITYAFFGFFLFCQPFSVFLNEPLV